MKTFEVQTPALFLRSFNDCAKTAKKRIWVQTMNFDPDERVNVFMNSLSQASHKGLDVRVNVDWISQIFLRGRFDFFPTLNVKKRQSIKIFNEKRQQMYSMLKTAGVKLIITNKPTLITKYLPALRRNHIKMYIVDDKVAWVGGVNLMEYAFDNLDLMVKIEDPRVIKALSDQFGQVNDARPAQDYVKHCGKDTDFFADSGKLGKSIIHTQSLKMINEAEKEIIFISQMVPDFSLLNSLINASKSGVEITIITSNSDDELFKVFPYRLLYDLFIAKIRGQKNISLIHLNTKVHVKLLLVDSEKALFGSHNFSQVGILFGTEEIALMAKNRKLISDFHEYIKSIYATSSNF